jgi:hypothetical protein
MEINIASLLSRSDFDPAECSGSRAELGDDAGRITWQNSMAAAAVPPVLLDTPEKLDAMRDFARSSGGWTQEEVDAWSAQEVNALLVQWVAGDIRQAFDDAEPADWDWVDYEKRAERGSVPSNLSRGADGAVYFDL